MDHETTGDGTEAATTPPSGSFLPPTPGTPRTATLAPPTGAPVPPVVSTPPAVAAAATGPTGGTPVPPTESPYLPRKRALPPLAPVASIGSEVRATAAASATTSAEVAAPPVPPVGAATTPLAPAAHLAAPPAPTVVPVAAAAPGTVPPPAAPPSPGVGDPDTTAAILPRVIVPPVPRTVLHEPMPTIDLTPPGGTPAAEVAPVQEAAPPPVFTPLTPLTPLSAATPGMPTSEGREPVAPAPAVDRATAAQMAAAKAAGAAAAAAKDRPIRRSPAAPKERSARSRAVTALALLALIGLIGAGGVLVSRAMSTSEHPTAWSEAIAPLAQYVETARETPFDHPVEVVLHTDAEYATVLASEHYRAPAPLDPEYAGAYLHTLGLVPDEGVQAAQMTLAISHAEAFYSWTTSTIHVRGAEGTPMSEATEAAVVGALVEAWYAQRFEDAKRDVSAVDVAFATTDGIRLAARHAGGDATAGDLAAGLRGDQDWTMEGPLEAADVPWTIRDLIAAEVLLPARLLIYTANHPELATLDSLTAGTLTEYRLVAPWAPLPSGSTPELDSAIPDDRPVVVKNAPFPMLPMLVSLAAWTDWPTARSAVQGWRTAVASTYRQASDDALCLAVRVAFTDFPDAFVTGVTAWGDAMGRPITPVANGNEVQFSLCDTAAAPAPFPTEQVGATASALLSIAAAAPAKDEVERAALLCAADEVVRSGAADEMLRTRDVARAIAEVLRPGLLQLARQCAAQR